MLSVPTWAAYPAGALQGFVEVNGVHLQYLDWGGTGPAVIFVHGLGDDPHAFDDFAPALIDRFHVLAYARRGSGSSDQKGPYDLRTLTEDLREFMQALKLDKAVLVGYSAGGEEITELAVEDPQRVDKLVYLDAAYDWSGESFKELLRALPKSFFSPPTEAMRSLEAFRSYLHATMFSDVKDMSRLEAYVRARVLMQPDGSVKYRISKETVEALYAALESNKARDYRSIRCPALAVYATTLYDLKSPEGRERMELANFEQAYWRPFQVQSLAHLRRELRDVQVARLSGTHSSFLLTNRTNAAHIIREFLLGRSSTVGLAGCADSAEAAAASGGACLP